MSELSASRRRVLKLAGVGMAGIAGVGQVTATDEQIDDNSDPTEIKNWHDLDGVREELDGDYVLVNNLDEETAGYDEHVGDPDARWEPIGDADVEFSGTFDGNSHEIADLDIDRPETQFVGLFGGNEGAIKNVTVADADITGDQYVGCLVGANVNDGEISESSVRGTDVSGGIGVGGLVGRNDNEVWASSVSNVDIGGDVRIAGLVGENSDGATVGESSAHGGEIKGELRVGGVVGNNLGEVTKSAVRDVDVTGGNSAGGLVGSNGADGEVWKSSVREVDVTGYKRIGGLVGSSSRGEIAHSFTTGEVNGIDNVGGLLGKLGTDLLDEGEEGILRDAYWDTETTGQSDAIGAIEEGNGTAETRGDVTGLTADEMQGEAVLENMAALDFEETWTIQTVPDGYPVLQWRQLIVYANDERIIDTDGYRDAVDDWRAGDIETDLLGDVIDAWRSTEQVE